MADLQVQAVSQEQALQALQARPVRGQDPAALASAGVPFELLTDDGRLLLVLEDHKPILWVTAATGEGREDMTRTGLEFIEHVARQAGFAEVAFTTTRRGLVRKACRLGYSQHGATMQKVIQ